jgi:hypothetical protein
MSEEARYLIFLIEHYAAAKGIDGDAVFALFYQNDLMGYIRDRYYTYHTERVENAISDIDSILAAKR